MNKELFICLHLSIILFYRWGNWHTQSLKNFTKVIQLVSATSLYSDSSSLAPISNGFQTQEEKKSVIYCQKTCYPQNLIRPYMVKKIKSCKPVSVLWIFCLIFTSHTDPTLYQQVTGSKHLCTLRIPSPSSCPLFNLHLYTWRPRIIGNII